MSSTSNSNNSHNLAVESKQDRSNTVRIPDRVDLRGSPRSRQGSPSHSPRLGPSRFLNGEKSGASFVGAELLGKLWGDRKKQPKNAKRKGGKVWYQKRRVKGLVVVTALVGLFFLVDWIMLLRLQDHRVGSDDRSSRNASSVSAQVKVTKPRKGKKHYSGIYGRLLALAAHALAEEPVVPASAWRPCADQRDWEPNEGKNGYIMVTANGGINQQRVAVCNAVVLARLLNATLAVPKFMYSSVWKDVSQFGDIYQEEHFIKYLAPDIRIVKELPEELKSLDLEAIGSVVTDVDVRKESKPSFYLKDILPILLQKRVVHFVGFGNRLAFDPIPFQLQIQETAALLLERLHKHSAQPGLLDHYLVGPHAVAAMIARSDRAKASKYLALHLRFEIDMVAHSLCEFGGGEQEGQELEAYRQIHFPALTELKKTEKLPSPAMLRSEGLCPLTPEEAVLMLAALGFNRKTQVYVAGAQIYGGTSRLAALRSLYPNLVTKENLLSSAELEPFKNFSSQVVFTQSPVSDIDYEITNQLSSLVSGYRIYYGGGRMPTIRPNKRRLADIFVKNNTIEWKVFEQRVRKAVRQTKHVQSRPKARSVYRYPRCKECMCRTD
ncbi:hypothetical protein GOBAR_AA36184 [Gossypium barbadense]|uniref:O-fucosyltransferase family protein n=1 Tax=Gossypium barbadense TaxID=3634 RepID=A0A2P5W0A6_GOSBA|nr:hypothetical protein GOBAR_AA36184 [Gossypium barbadense]